MTDRKNKLDIGKTLQAIDRKDYGFYSRLSDDDKKAYCPFVLMKFMSVLTDQNQNKDFAVLMVNDLVNIRFWELSKHTELLHLLLCLTGVGGKSYRPWLATKKLKNNDKINNFLLEFYPSLNEEELNIIRDNFDMESWEEFVKGAGLDDRDSKELINEWKKLGKV